MKKIKSIAALVLYLGAMWLLFDILTSYALVYYYRIKEVPNAIAKEEAKLSSVIFVKKIIDKLAQRTHVATRYLQPDAVIIPSPMYGPDPDLGYRAKPDKYSVIFQRTKEPGVVEKLITKVTIDGDGNRWLGDHVKNNGRPNVYIFGDSYIFGWGVDDEQSLAYLLQQNRKDLNVTLLANGGYSLTQAYLNFERLKPTLRPEDVLILGYTAYYKRRHVMAPSRIVENGEPPSTEGSHATVPRATLGENGQIKIDYISAYCKFSGDYCKKPDPSPEEMNRVTAALINHIARNTPAQVFLLHFGGEHDYYEQIPTPHDAMPEMLDKRVKVIHAMDNEFGSFVRDSVAGFDSHPGPYWHYAMFTKLKDLLAEIAPKTSSASAEPAPK